MTRQLVLASSSRYRRALLERLRLPFTAASPDVDETPAAAESPRAMVERLSQAKAAALSTRFSEALIIGSDQCVVQGDRIIGKPGTHAAAREQLKAASGQRVEVLTGLCLLDAATQATWLDVVTYEVEFRTLDDAEIERYLLAEQPYDCAGSIQSEGLGIALLRHMRGDDPSALVGLPLIRLCEMLRAAGVSVPP
ncbi:septum formation protein Maf [Acidihalobacter aeolianus]|uniref:7-methyl-GTP pyrophosphatase n=1 Tax=Acidihalobacter aeolianus TaxID=2792603 RepID=A0A1D8K810_9GAMM|nr:nucleoside triphosphate pyrophosphatase [Acidihalobacter aeolianus]AOV17070.1 septum formation protein Maf [Acidihalobacter aeolianus]